PFNWWLFLFVVIFFPLFGGILYLIFWLATSRATVFLHQDGEQVHEAGDLWLVRSQEARRTALIEEQRPLQGRGVLAPEWPPLLVSLLLLFVWIALLRRYW